MTAMTHAIATAMPALSDLLAWQAKAAVVLAITLGAAFALRHAPSTWRRTVLAWGLLCAVAMPLLGALLGPSLSLSVSAPAVDLPSFSTASPIETMTTESAASTEAIAGATSDGPTLHWSLLLLAVYLGGVIVGLWRLLRTSIGAAVLRANTVTASTRLQDLHRRACRRAGVHADLRVHSRSTVPLVLGARRPVVILPRPAEDWSDERLQAVLLHELGHVAHGDHRWFPLLAIARALTWIDPLAWLVLARFHREAEFAADDAAIDRGMRASSYAAELMGISRLRLHSVAAPSVPALGHPRLSDRIRRVLAEPRAMVRLRRVVPVTLGALGAAVAIALVQAGAPVPVESLGGPSPAAMTEQAADPDMPRLAEVPPVTETIALSDGPRVVLAMDALRLSIDGTRTDLRLPMQDGRLLEGATTRHLVTALYDALEASGIEPQQRVTLFADVGVPWPTVVDTLYTSGRAGVARYALAVRIGDGVRALDVSPPRFPEGDEIANDGLRLRVYWDEGTTRRLVLAPRNESGADQTFVEQWTPSTDRPDDMAGVALRACTLGGGHPVEMVVQPSAWARHGEIVETIALLHRPCGGTTVLEAGPS